MAVPKNRVSKKRSNTRYSNNSGLASPNLVECAQCGEKVAAHNVCPKCGYYKSVKRMTVGTDS